MGEGSRPIVTGLLLSPTKLSNRDSRKMLGNFQKAAGIAD
jgi:hypothetical protein